MNLCADIAFLARQNAENENLYKHMNQVEY